MRDAGHEIFPQPGQPVLPAQQQQGRAAQAEREHEQRRDGRAARRRQPAHQQHRHRRRRNRGRDRQIAELTTERIRAEKRPGDGTRAEERPAVRAGHLDADQRVRGVLRHQGRREELGLAQRAAERSRDLFGLDHHAVDRACAALPAGHRPEQHHIGGAVEPRLAGREHSPLPPSLAHRRVGRRARRRRRESVARPLGEPLAPPLQRDGAVVHHPEHRACESRGHAVTVLLRQQLLEKLRAGEAVAPHRHPSQQVLGLVHAPAEPASSLAREPPGRDRGVVDERGLRRGPMRRRGPYRLPRDGAREPECGHEEQGTQEAGALNEPDRREATHGDGVKYGTAVRCLARIPEAAGVRKL